MHDPHRPPPLAVAALLAAHVALGQHPSAVGPVLSEVQLDRHHALDHRQLVPERLPTTRRPNGQPARITATLGHHDPGRLVPPVPVAPHEPLTLEPAHALAHLLLAHAPPPAQRRHRHEREPRRPRRESTRSSSASRSTRRPGSAAINSDADATYGSTSTVASFPRAECSLTRRCRHNRPTDPPLASAWHSAALPFRPALSLASRLRRCRSPLTLPFPRLDPPLPSTRLLAAVPRPSSPLLGWGADHTRPPRVVLMVGVCGLLPHPPRQPSHQAGNRRRARRLVEPSEEPCGRTGALLESQSEPRDQAAGSHTPSLALASAVRTRRRRG